MTVHPAMTESACPKCEGTGKWTAPKNPRIVRDCFGCNGTGKVQRIPQIACDATTLFALFARHPEGTWQELVMDGFNLSSPPGRDVILVRQRRETIARIYPDHFEPFAKFKTALAENTDLLGKILLVVLNPGEEIKQTGRRTGTCSCCGRLLTNPESVELGIGPICREQWGF